MSEIIGAMFKYMMVLLGLGAVVAVFWNTMALDKTGKALSGQTELQANVIDLFSGQNNFTNLTNTVMIQSKKVPDSMLAGTAIKNPWGGDVTLSVNSSNAAQFDTTQNLIPADACTKMATSNQKIVALRINGSVVSIPIDAAAAASACNNTTNTLVFTVNR